MSIFAPQNPGIGGLDELTPTEELFLTSLAALDYENGDIIYYNNGIQKLGIGSASQVLTVNSGVPSWQDASGGGSFTLLDATGTVNSINTQFTFTEKPSIIVSDHAMYKETNKLGETIWTWNAGTLTATLVIPPQSDIYGLK